MGPFHTRRQQSRPTGWRVHPIARTPVDGSREEIMMAARREKTPAPQVISFDDRACGRRAELDPVSPCRTAETEVCMADEKPKPNFSNVQSGGSSTAPSAPSAATPTAAAPAATPAAPRTYTVVAGDTLSKIAKQFYGDANQWKGIFDANRDILKNPDLIHPGQTLKIPDK